MDRLKIDSEPKKILVISEPYVIYTGFSYQPVINIIEKKTKRTYYIYISAKSIGQALYKFVENNNGNMIGLEFWISKESDNPKSLYILQE